VVLGPKWLDAVLPLQLLALSMPIRFIALALPPYLKGLGHVRLSMTNTMLAFVLLPVAFLVASAWGALGMCIAWLVVYPPYFAVTVVRAGRVTPITLGAVLRATARPAAAAAAMYVAVFAVGMVLPVTISPILHLAVLISLGAAIYVGLMLGFNRAAWLEAVELMVPPRFQVWRGATRSCR
jgi:O-antigen/teichoic acid export membrane protein